MNRQDIIMQRWSRQSIMHHTTFHGMAVEPFAFQAHFCFASYTTYRSVSNFFNSLSLPHHFPCSKRNWSSGRRTMCVTDSSRRYSCATLGSSTEPGKTTLNAHIGIEKSHDGIVHLPLPRSRTRLSSKRFSLERLIAVCHDHHLVSNLGLINSFSWL